MPYATQGEMETRYGPDAVIVVSDRNHNGQPDVEAIGLALDDASAEIDTYLATRYQLPLDEVPGSLVRCAVDISMYRLAADRAVATDEHRRRYEDAIRFLKDLATGKASLGLEEEPPTRPATAPAITGPKRLFNRETLTGF